MKTRSTNALSRLRMPIVALFGLALLATCVENEEAPVFYLKGVAAVTQQEQCVARANPRSMRAFGTMDTWMTNRYILFPIMENYLESTLDEPLYGEINNIQILGAKVTFDYPANLDGATKAVLDKEWFHVTSGSVLAGEPGISIVNIVDPEVGNALSKDPFIGSGFEIVANVAIEGRLSDGSVVTTNTMYFPIKVCYQCLYMIVTDNCADLSSAQDMRPPCLIGQDDGVDCRLFTLIMDENNTPPQ